VQSEPRRCIISFPKSSKDLGGRMLGQRFGHSARPTAFPLMNGSDGWRTR
jgi:hypothetical protein